MILSAERLAQLRSALGMDVKRPADLVEEVQWLAEQCNALEAVRNQLDSQLGDLMSAICKAAVHDPDMAKTLSELDNALDSDLRSRFDIARKYFTNEHTSLPTVTPAAVPDGEPHPQPTGQIYVTLTAARQFMEGAGHQEHELETARRRVTELLLDTRLRQADPRMWRARKRSTKLDISALWSRRVACSC